MLTKGLAFWKTVRFSDEVHFGLGPQRKLHIIRRPDERYCYDFIQEKQQPEDKGKKEEEVTKRFHCWAMVGWNYKSNLVFYEVPTNKNGKMSQTVYLNILEDYVKPLLDQGEEFTLEEDNDSGHGTGNNSKVWKWKEKQRLKYYFNCPKSPDLSIIENCWQPIKQHLSMSN